MLAETVPSGFVPPRPFRVNAGPVHSYVLMADGSTKYLSEVRAGDEVLAARAGDPSGEGGRSVVVGRCKVEPRPVVRVDFGGREGGEGGANEWSGQIFLQQAETVRLAAVAGPSGEADGLPVTSIAPGDRILARRSTSGTHVGKRISARVTET